MRNFICLIVICLIGELGLIGGIIDFLIRILYKIDFVNDWLEELFIF